MMSCEAGTAMLWGCGPTSMRPSGLLVATSTMVTSSPVLLVTYSFWRTAAGSAATATEERVNNASARQLQRVSTAAPPGTGESLQGARENHAARVADRCRIASGKSRHAAVTRYQPPQAGAA